jgi:capsular exopolysaccharide synthesis family protein
VSKNFELLQQVGKEHELLGNDQDSPKIHESPKPPASRPALSSVSPMDSPSGMTISPGGPMLSSNGHRRRLKLEARTKEEAMKLVQRLFVAPGPNAPRVVVFSSVEHGDGCSSVCTCVAETLAARGAGSVCVVDGNVHTPSLHNYFGLANRSGLAEAMVHTAPIRTFAQKVHGKNLWVITCGSAASDLPAMLGSDQFRSRMKELREAFDCVLIDAPPANLYGDAVTLGQLSDGMILVLQSSSTRREAARKAKETLDAANVRLLGAVLNKRSYPIPQVLYDKL